jgi:Zn-dependent protease with chaperone function
MHKLLTRALVAAFLLASGCSPAAAFAQKPAGRERLPFTAAFVSVTLHANGSVDAEVTAPGDGRAWTEAMGRFLGGPVEARVAEGENPDFRALVRRQFELVGGARRAGWVNYLEADPAPVVALLRGAGVRTLHLQITIGDKQAFAECTLPTPAREQVVDTEGEPEPNEAEPDEPERGVPAVDVARAMRSLVHRFGPPVVRHFQRGKSYHYQLPITDTAVPPFRVAYGYRPEDFLALAPLALLPLPVLWTLWRRRRVLSRPDAALAAAWWGYGRSLRRLEIGIGLFWAFAVMGTPAGALLDRLAHAAVGIPTAGRPLFVGWDWLSLAVYALPPATVGFLCVYLSYPVYTRARGLKWTRWEMAWHAVKHHVVPWLNLLLLAAMAAGLMNGAMRRAFGWGLAGLLVVALPRLGIWTGRRVLWSLDTGVVRDRVFELARRAGVQVNQVYLWPTKDDRAANAAAAVGDKVLLTDYLLQHLSKRQVDWVVAHELVHLRHRHPGAAARGLWVVGVGLYLGFFYLWFAAPTSPGLQRVLGGLVQCRFGVLLLLHLGLLVVYNFGRRRNEFLADREAVTVVGGDLEAAVTALAKLGRLNGHPLEWGRLDENLLTHPSDARRIQALVDESETDPERLPDMLAAADRDGDRYPVPDNPPGEHLLLTEFRTRRAAALRRLGLALLVLLPALLAAGIGAAGWRGPPAWGAAAGGILLALAALRTLKGYAAVRGEGRLRTRLAARCKEAGFDTEAWQGHFVALAPARAPRRFASGFDWDVGFLFLTSDRLCYVGCLTRFALPRDRVKAVRVGPGSPRWGRSSRVYVTWCDEQGTATTWNLRPAGAASVPGSQRQVPQLLRALQDWHQAPPAGTTPGALAALSAPALGPVTSETVATYVRTNPVRRALATRALGSGGLAFLFGCSFDLLPSPGWGWYAPALTCLMVLFERVPLWLYREPRVAVLPSVPTVEPAGRTGA